MADSPSSDFIQTGKLPVADLPVDPLNDDLWLKIEAFQFDNPEDDLSFNARLARKNGWKSDYAIRVVEEYKRFVYLAMRADHEVTPSDDVDQAWHLHLTYSKNYWDEFCKNVLEMPLHHGPTKGGKQEAEKYWEQYQRTLDSYKAISGDEAPNDIWPSPRDRFADVSAMRRINGAQNWVIRKPSIQQFRIIRWGALVVGIAFVVAGYPWVAVCAGAFWIMCSAVMTREEKLATRRYQEDGNLTMLAGGYIMTEGLRGDGLGRHDGHGGGEGGGCGGCGGG
ncbi:MAG: hypothetical protein GKS01_10845 [Alphaproteobacteria bacterium]|nr:hypothetical protein [Alphaproteobacteria bacterium]